MKREIKFRAWHTVLNQHLPNVQNHINDKDWAFGAMLKDPERFIIEQFTGLKDMAGVEIYEGDLLTWGMKVDNFTVIFEDGCFMYWNKIKMGGELDWASIKNKELEVIGNIHQNKDKI